MRYAIVCGHYMPEAGYYEVHIAEALAKAGHTVRVFTSDRSNLLIKKERTYPSGLYTDTDSGVEVLRFRPRFRMGSTVVAAGIKKEILKFNPDVVMAIGIAKLFPYPVLAVRNRRHYNLYSFFGENAEYYSWNSFTSALRSSVKIITRSVLKRPFYQVAIRNSDRIFLYTPDTYDFIKRLVSGRSFRTLESKHTFTSLGFDNELFYYNEDERIRIREKLGIPDAEFILLTVTRYSRSKSIGFIIDSVVSFRAEGYPIKYWIIGFDRDEDILTVENYIKCRNASEFITCYRFMDYEQLRAYQAAADLGIWCQVTISIQQSMGTGLPVLLEQKPSVSHLIKSDKTGFYFTRDNLAEKLTLAFKSFGAARDGYTEMRKQIEKINLDHFAYRNLIDQIIDL